MCMRLEGKVCVVTGAASGLGREISMVFAKEGAKVALFDIGDEAGCAVQGEIEGKQGIAKFFHCNVADEENVKKAIDDVCAEYGKVDVLVNNTGIFTAGSVTETSFTDYRKVMGVNLDGAYLCMKYAIEKMLVSGGGSVINIASEAGLLALPGQVAYNVSKAAMIMLTKSAAVDFATKNIRVNCICPGRVRTPLVDKILNEAEDYEKTLKELSEDRPMKRMGKPHEIAQGAVYLASDESLYATGTVLNIDGGSSCV